MTLTGLLMVLVVVMLGILVGVTIPAIRQLRETLRSLQVFLDESRPKLNEALVQVGEAISRVNRLSERAEGTLEKAHQLIDTLNEARQPILAVRDGLRRFGWVLTALGPALAAGLGALWSSRSASGAATAASGETAEDKEAGR